MKQKKYYFDTQYEPCVTKPHSPGWTTDCDDNRPGTDRRSDSTSNKRIFGANGLRQMRGAFIGPIQPFKGAHFATYPTWLIKPLIEAACPRRICNECGTIMMPVYDTHIDLRERLNDVTEPCEDAGPSANDYAGLRRRMVGYDARCDCDARYHRGVVFDPFMGAGTTAVVAEELGLDWIGIELSKQYIKMSYRRLHNEQRKRNN